MRDIRDARMPCEHGKYEPHMVFWEADPGVPWSDPVSCRGGRPVTVDDLDVREAAYAVATLEAPGMEDFATQHARGILAAALKEEGGR